MVSNCEDLSYVLIEEGALATALVVAPVYFCGIQCGRGWPLCDPQWHLGCDRVSRFIQSSLSSEDCVLSLHFTEPLLCTTFLVHRKAC